MLNEWANCGRRDRRTVEVEQNLDQVSFATASAESGCRQASRSITRPWFPSTTGEDHARPGFGLPFTFCVSLHASGRPYLWKRPSHPVRETCGHWASNATIRLTGLTYGPLLSIVTADWRFTDVDDDCRLEFPNQPSAFVNPFNLQSASAICKRLLCGRRPRLHFVIDSKRQVVGAGLLQAVRAGRAREHGGARRDVHGLAVERHGAGPAEDVIDFVLLLHGMADAGFGLKARLRKTASGRHVPENE